MQQYRRMERLFLSGVPVESDGITANQAILWTLVSDSALLLRSIDPPGGPYMGNSEVVLRGRRLDRSVAAAVAAHGSQMFPTSGSM